MADWAASFSPKGVDQATMTSGAGSWENFLARGLWAGAGGIAAEQIHAWMVNNKSEYSFLSNFAEETVGLVGVVGAAYLIERYAWKGPGGKVFTAGMAGRYGAAMLDWLKQKGKAQDLGEADSMDTSARMRREVGEVMKNSPRTLDMIADIMANNLVSVKDPESEFAGKDPKHVAAQLRQEFSKVASKIAA